jgi:hypothetical protein
MIGKLATVLILAATAWPGLDRSRAEESKPLYENNFEKAEIGKAPDDFLILDGAFAVQEADGNKFLELPGAPLDSYGVLFGPTVRTNVEVSARIKSAGKGRRFPTFAVGLNGQAGYRLQVSPAKKLAELYRADEVVASAPYEWKSGQWTLLQLKVASAGSGWVVAAKVWTQGESEPEKDMISYQEQTEPRPGRATIWGSPFSGAPIQFDDLLLKTVSK